MRPPTLDMLYELLKTVPDAWLYRVPSLGWLNYTVYLRLDKAPFNDVRVRQALSMAINRDIVKETINRGDASLYGPFPWVQAGYTKREDYSYANLGPNYAYNPAQAKQLLAEAGYPNGFEITLEWGELRALPMVTLPWLWRNSSRISACAPKLSKSIPPSGQPCDGGHNPSPMPSLPSRLRALVLHGLGLLTAPLDVSAHGERSTSKTRSWTNCSMPGASRRQSSSSPSRNRSGTTCGSRCIASPPLCRRTTA